MNAAVHRAACAALALVVVTAVLSAVRSRAPSGIATAKGHADVTAMGPPERMATLRAFLPGPAAPPAEAETVIQGRAAEPDYVEVSATVGELVEARRNLFFRPRDFVADALGRDAHLVAHALAFLVDAALAADGDPDPEGDDARLRERMGAVDLLATVGRAGEQASDRAEARDALAALAAGAEPDVIPTDPVARGLHDLDRADALTALTRVDPDRALDLYHALPADRRGTMRAAVGGGLLDIGRSRTDALRLVDSAPRR